MPDDARYPIGHWSTPDADPATLAALVDDIAHAPAALRAAVTGLDVAQLDTPYREGGWTVRQVVHHVADSHMNAYVRVKKALTEPGTPIAAYDEARWAELPDSRLEPEVSLQLIDALHARWTTLLRALAPADWEKTYAHPEMGQVTLRTALGIYAWHGRHHTAHITGLRERNGW
ncbi:MAG: YfiT family bacillithiol transferase [Gemmatirosa sp.]